MEVCQEINEIYIASSGIISINEKIAGELNLRSCFMIGWNKITRLKFLKYWLSGKLLYILCIANSFDALGFCWKLQEIVNPFIQKKKGSEIHESIITWKKLFNWISFLKKSYNFLFISSLKQENFRMGKLIWDHCAGHPLLQF